MSRMKKHKGKPKPRTGFGFPQRLRERKKEKRRRRTYQTAKERERGHQTPKRTRGQVLKGTRTNSISTPKTKKNHTKNQTTIPKAPNKRQHTNQTESQRNCHSRVEGPMGRPALLGSHPRGPQYRRVQVPPHYGNRARWRKSWHTSRHKTDTPKALSWRLASPHYANTHPTPS